MSLLVPSLAAEATNRVLGAALIVARMAPRWAAFLPVAPSGPLLKLALATRAPMSPAYLKPAASAAAVICAPRPPPISPGYWTPAAPAAAVIGAPRPPVPALRTFTGMILTYQATPAIPN